MKLLIIGATGESYQKVHPSGQLTLVNKLREILSNEGINHCSIDSYIENFPRISFPHRLFKAFVIQLKIMHKLLVYRPTGVMVFGDIGLSLYEKSLMILWCRLLKINCALMICAGYNHLLCLDRIRKHMVKLLLKMPNHVIVQGETSERFLLKTLNLKNKISVIHNWFIANKLKTKKQQTKTELTILFCGWLVEQKGVKDLFQVAEKFMYSHPGAKFVFAGDGALWEWCKDEINNKKLTNISMLGWVSMNKMDALFSSADIFVLPSHMEGFPLVVNEAMSQGLPIVSTQVGAIPDSVIDGQNGYCVEPKNTNQLSAAIGNLVTNPKLRDEFGIQSLEILNTNHNPTVCLEKLMRLFGHQKEHIFD